MTPWETLKLEYPWPEFPPNRTSILEGLYSGWFAGESRKMLWDSLKDATYLLEIGTWLGMSARLTLDQFPNLKMICIDHWKGSSEHQGYSRDLLDNLYEIFLVNCWDYRARLIPVREESTKGIYKVLSRDFVPDVVYLDANHETEAVLTDVRNIITHFPKTIIVGDDFTWLSVVAATEILRKEYPHYSFEANRTAWAMIP